MIDQLVIFFDGTLKTGRIPAHIFAYSLGAPAGKTKREDGGCPLLVGADGKQVPYSIGSATCTAFMFFFERDI